MASNENTPSSSTNSVGATKTNNDSSPAVSTTRLTSFRAPRDLTLGGNFKTEKTKKVYAPNLNVQRKKKSDEVVKIEKERDDRPKSGREHIRAKKTANLIQSAGVFSEASESVKKRFSRGGGYSRDSSSDRNDKIALEKPKLGTIGTVDKEAEDAKLRLLLRDDFIDDKKEILLDNAPTLLPLNNPKNIYVDNYAALFKKKDIKVETDVKEIITNGEIKKSPKKGIVKMEQDEKVSSILDVLENKLTSNYIFMQFPSCLPILQSEDNDQSNALSKKQSAADSSESSKSKTNECSMNNIKEGCIGKLQVLRSGKVRLLLGGHKFNVEKGTTTSFRQDLVAMKVDENEKTGDFINLGPVNNTMIVSVDLESLLNET